MLLIYFVILCCVAVALLRVATSMLPETAQQISAHWGGLAGHSSQGPRPLLSVNRDPA